MLTKADVNAQRHNLHEEHKGLVADPFDVYNHNNISSTTQSLRCGSINFPWGTT